MKRNKNKGSWKKVDGRWTATLPNSATDQVRAMRTASREQAKENGTLGRTYGSGVHGGSDEVRNRRERRQSKVDLRRGNWD